MDLTSELLYTLLETNEYFHRYTAPHNQNDKKLEINTNCMWLNGNCKIIKKYNSLPSQSKHVYLFM